MDDCYATRYVLNKPLNDFASFNRLQSAAALPIAASLTDRLGKTHPESIGYPPTEHHGQSDSFMDSHWVDTQLDGLSAGRLYFYRYPVII